MVLAEDIIMIIIIASYIALVYVYSKALVNTKASIKVLLKTNIQN